MGNNVLIFVKRRRDLRFGDLAGLDAAGADELSSDRAFDLDFDALQVGMETAQGLSDDLGTGTAGPLDRTASLIFVAGDRAFIADDTNSSHRISLECCGRDLKAKYTLKTIFVKTIF